MDQAHLSTEVYYNSKQQGCVKGKACFMEISILFFVFLQTSKVCTSEYINCFMNNKRYISQKSCNTEKNFLFIQENKIVYLHKCIV